MTISDSYKKFTTIAFTSMLLALFFVFFMGSAKVDALSGSSFKAGRIIDDSVFFDNATMTPQQIQSFLNSKVPVCDTNGTQIYSGSTTRAQYGASRGYPAPYTCLKSYTQAIPNITNSSSDYCNRNIVGGTKSAAQIIYDVSVACGINPQVLIVLLQKEQSLITDDWPWSMQYRSATGYGCPDTAPCDAQYYGFFNQVYQAAKAFKRYEANPTDYNYRAKRNNYIYYSPRLAPCGGSNVYIENQATANLYIYTPYQPNRSALDNLYGSGDSCGAYGNRNFWRLFNDWFGSTVGGENKAQFYRQGQHAAMFPGGVSTSYIDYKNIGLSNWYDAASVPNGQKPISLATTSGINRTSAFGSSWGSGRNRPAVRIAKVYEANGSTLSPDQTKVRPGQIARFEITFRASSSQRVGQYTEWFQPIIEGSPNWNIGGTAWLRVTVPQPVNKAQFHSQGSYVSMTRNTTKSSFIRYKNVGNQTWYSRATAPAGQKSISLATTNPINRASPFGANWGSGRNRPSVTFAKVYEANGVTLSPNQGAVRPGQIVRFDITFKTSTTQAKGQYTEWFQPIVEGSSSWNIGAQAWLRVTVQ